MTLVVDASVAVKWVLNEADSNRARALIGADELIAPDFLLLECANVLARQVRRKLIGPDSAKAGLLMISEVDVRLIASSAYVRQAQRVALSLGAAVYDSLYLTVALVANATLVTADSRFANAASAAHPGAVRLL